MSFPLRPDIRVDTVFDITPELLLSKNIKLLLVDLDNTLLTYTQRGKNGGLPSKRILAWKKSLNVKGIKVAIVSNTRTERARIYASGLNTEYIDKARKPSSKAIIAMIERRSVDREHTALVGDQIFTDVLGANRSGIMSIVTKPLKLHNTLIALRYAVEIPFRLSRRKEKNVK